MEFMSVSKTFAGTKALEDVSFTIEPAEIHALVGQNGSGKSTLIKILSGFHQPDDGSRARLSGVDHELGNAQAEGSDRIRFVHQDLGLILQLSAMDNFALKSGFLTGRGGRVQWDRQAQRAVEMVAKLGIDIDVRAPLSAATPVERTGVAIAAAMSEWEVERGLLVLDEPTAVLTHSEVELLLGMVRSLRDQGASIMYVSHRLDEIFQIADRVSVLRDGRLATTRKVSELNAQALAELMVGDRVDAGFRLHRSVDPAPVPALSVRALSGGVLDRFDLDVQPGEILGVAGFAGSGAVELPYLLAGLTTSSAQGTTVRAASWGQEWKDASALLDLSIPLVPADRTGAGIIAEFGVRENLTLGILDSLTGATGVSSKNEYAAADEWMRKLEVKASSADAPILSLSGGNQQKVVIGKCLAGRPDLLIMAEPTAGVDVGTRQAIYELIGRLADEGLAVVVTSSDTGDLLALANRVIVLNRGKQVAEFVGDEITERSLLGAMEAEESCAT
jgi:ribose transport system ATP-binding protein